MAEDRYLQYPTSRFSPYDEQGYNRRGQRQIRGPQGPAKGFGGLNEYYALQNRNIPAFDPRGGVPTAGQFAQFANSIGVDFGRGGTLMPAGRPMTPTQFRTSMQEGATPASQSLAGGMSGSALDAPSGEGFGIPRPRPRTPDENRARLEEAAGANRLLKESTDPTQFRMNPGEGSFTSTYGSGSINRMTPEQFAKRPEAMVNGRPFSEVMQGLANKPGIARPGDRYQPQTMASAAEDKLRKRSPRPVI